MSEPQVSIDVQLKELEREKKEEELRQLRTNATVRWITPTALAALLPLAAGFGLWVLSEMKQYSAGYQALRAKEELEKEKAELRKEKHDLNVEIDTLLHLKEHYAEQATQLKDEVEAKQATMDKVFLRAVFTNAEMVYSLDHIKGMGEGPQRKEIDTLSEDIKQLPAQSAETMRNVLNRYELMETIIQISRDMAVAYQKAVNVMPASDWARELDPMPSGAVLSERNIMVDRSGSKPRYYDIEEGRFLSEEESKEAK